MKVVLFAKERPGLNNAIAFLKIITSELIIYKGKVGDSFPEESIYYKPDLTISYISPWILPIDLLKATRKWAINFHPGPPEYPGIGCTNFAIYEEAYEFGVTAHVMEEKVDSGRIINVKRFPIQKRDTVYSLTQRCYDYILVQFYEVLNYIFKNNSLPKCNENWGRKPFTRRQLNNLCRITNDMTNEEIKRRIRAVTYPGMPGAYIEIFGEIFEYKNRVKK